MVGISGRSRGCVTCRKRKKRCDLQRPECRQCQGRDTACGGYDLDRIFVYQTGRGNDFAAKKPVPNPDTGATPSQPLQRNQMLPVGSVLESKVWNPRQPPSIILPDAFARSAYTEKVMSTFIQMYLPRGRLAAADAEGREFVNMLSLLTVRDQALQLAVQAIGTAALGQSTGDEALTRQGRVLYGAALSETAAALRDSSRAKSEAALMVPRIMALFEVLFGAEASSPARAKSWLSHAIGETALILGRDAEAYSYTDTAHSMFVNTRFRLVVSAVRTRTATVLNNKEWKTLPWRSRVKTVNDTLVDIFCGVPELREAVETLGSSAFSESKAGELRRHTVAKAWTLHHQLQDWLVANPRAIYTPTAPDCFDRINTIKPISFPHFECACGTLRYWVVALLIYSHLDTASGISPEDDWSTEHSDRPHPRKYARLIARSAPYFFQEQHGLTGATTMSFPLGMALLYMSRNVPADSRYISMAMKAWEQPLLASAVRDFLASMTKTLIPPSLAAKSGGEQ
ncbi:uncharacterized protein ALTATR162_LOCUS5009 [Alternaria atra]|uniref:Zn(2)-C6 fungal-type domain-containing protein n=1 Tax=Alternaria atra TaxID=119953 RepID=A0A8J2I446_9PLEO|nr:uncharacterized protein ALTATR162_LOCUS5009 [Alternaria atra]CAG5158151.1 unnamed protein product [Alternaria atra]